MAVRPHARKSILTSQWGPTGRVLSVYVAEIKRLLSTFFPNSARSPGELISELNRMGVAPEFGTIAEAIAHRMVTSIALGNARHWRAAAAKASKGRFIFEALSQELSGLVGAAIAQNIQENARLIQSLPPDLARKAAAYVAERQAEGIRSIEIARELHRKLPNVAFSRIKLIARTETAKAETAVTKARSENLGVRYYEWRTSEDSRVRRSHRFMDGVVVPWSSPPSPEALVGEPSEGHYPPGGIWNCRCIALPLISLQEISWPARVYVGGAVKSMNLNQFQRYAKFPVAA